MLQWSWIWWFHDCLPSNMFFCNAGSPPSSNVSSQKWANISVWVGRDRRGQAYEYQCLLISDLFDFFLFYIWLGYGGLVNCSIIYLCMLRATLGAAVRLLHCHLTSWFRNTQTASMQGLRWIYLSLPSPSSAGALCTGCSVIYLCILKITCNRTIKSALGCPLFYSYIWCKNKEHSIFLVWYEMSLLVYGSAFDILLTYNVNIHNDDSFK